MDHNYFWIPCTIENGGFSSERRFEVDLKSDSGKIVGTAYIEYLQNSDRKPLSEDEPAYATTITGFVKCRVVKREEDTVFLEFPGTDIFHVPQEALAGVEE